MKIKWHAIGIFLFLILAISIGASVYHNVEGWSYLDSTYFLVITATTIGYGDLTPVTDLGKVITMIYSFVGIAIAFYIVSLISNYFIDKRVKERVRKIKDK